MPMVMVTLPSFLPPPVAESSPLLQPATSANAPAAATAAASLFLRNVPRLLMNLLPADGSDASDGHVVRRPQRLQRVTWERAHVRVGTFPSMHGRLSVTSSSVNDLNATTRDRGVCAFNFRGGRADRPTPCLQELAQVTSAAGAAAAAGRGVHGCEPPSYDQDGRRPCRCRQDDGVPR